MNREELLRKIQELSFVKCELELFLDTHPHCTVALGNYTDTVNALKKLTDMYSAEYGPLVAAEVTGDKWTWASDPWPWHNTPANNARGEGKR